MARRLAALVLSFGTAAGGCGSPGHVGRGGTCHVTPRTNVFEPVYSDNCASGLACAGGEATYDSGAPGICCPRCIPSDAYACPGGMSCYGNGFLESDPDAPWTCHRSSDAGWRAGCE